MLIALSNFATDDVGTKSDVSPNNNNNILYPYTE